MTNKNSSLLTAILGLAIAFFIYPNVNAQDTKPKNSQERKNATEGRRQQGNGASGQRRGNPFFLLRTLDKNKDQKISKDEAPERMQGRFEQLDGNGDGFLDKTELEKLMSRRGQQGNGDSRSGTEKDSPRKGPESRDSTPRDSASRDGNRGRAGSFDFEQLFKAADKDGDGNLNKTEQATVIARLKEIQTRMRQAMGERGGRNQPSGSGSKSDKRKTGGDSRFAIPKTEPVKPKRPGME